MSQLTALQLLYTQYGDYPTPISAANPITRTSRRRRAACPTGKTSIKLNDLSDIYNCFIVSLLSVTKHNYPNRILVGQFIDLEIICSFEGKGGKNKGVAYAALSRARTDGDGEGQISQKVIALETHFVSSLRRKRNDGQLFPKNIKSTVIHCSHLDGLARWKWISCWCWRFAITRGRLLQYH